MHTTKVTVSDKDIQKYNGDLLVFLAVQSEDNRAESSELVQSYLKPLIDFEDFSAKPNDTAIFYPVAQAKDGGLSARRVLVVGLGKIGDDDSEELRMELCRSAGGAISKICEKFRVEDMLIADCVDIGLEQAEIAECVVEGVLLGDYRFCKYKKEEEENPAYSGLKKIAVHSSSKVGAMRKAVKRAGSTAFAVRVARDMANEPGNNWTATSFEEHAQNLAETHGLNCKIIDKAKMTRLGMGGILAVNQGSAEPPKLVILEYIPARKNKTIMLVGKGLTFDSGGVSLKPAQGMQDMKMDMCGGAAVISAMQAIAEIQPDVHVVALIPATDNMSGSSALKPGDIIRHYNGITSEIVNTDAEGRVILADALAYGIEKYKPDCAVDVATLTGAVIIGLGHHHTGILGNDDELVERIISAGKNTGEPLWRLPLGKEYTKQIDSQVADIKNAGGRPGGTITAAAYLEKFVGETPWAHLDIAGTAWDFTEKTYIPKGPSGIAVRTLVEFVCEK